MLSVETATGQFHSVAASTADTDVLGTARLVSFPCCSVERPLPWVRDLGMRDEVMRLVFW